MISREWLWFPEITFKCRTFFLFSDLINLLFNNKFQYSFSIIGKRIKHML